MKTKARTGWVALSCAAWAATVSSAWAQGSLTPPGAPAPTMRTLEQVQPRTPITNVPYTITQPGSYYLTANLTSDTRGVRIGASGVTLDLMGFTLTGNSSEWDGVYVDGTTDNLIRDVVVRNGILRGFRAGVLAFSTQNCRFEQLVLTGNHGFGFYANGKPFDGNIIAGCTISDNGRGGIYFLNPPGSRCNGNIITDCTVSSNRFYGVHFLHGQCNGNTITDCAIGGSRHGVVLEGDDGPCDGNTIANCVIGGCRSDGVVFLGGTNGQCNGNTIADCTISGNDGRGIYLQGVGGPVNGNTITRCAISSNGNYAVALDGVSGQCDGNTIVDCTLRGNVSGGGYLASAHGNRMEGNHISGQTGSTTYGIHCSSTAGNLILCNTCVGQATNFLMSAKDTYGPIVTNSGALATGGASAHPWANFSR